MHRRARRLRRHRSRWRRGLRRHGAALSTQLLLKLLVAELKLFERAGELPDLRLELVDSHRHVRFARPRRLLRLARLTAEQIVEQAALLGGRGRSNSNNNSSKGQHAARAGKVVEHGGTVGLSTASYYHIGRNKTKM